MSKFFINRPIVAIVISILMVIVGAVTIATCRGAISEHCSTGNSVAGHIPGR